jgi:hypothetical protein
MTVRVKLLNGDLLQIEHNPSDGFVHFVHQIYDACPDIPYGCLVLRRLGEDEEVHELGDDDELCAFVDPSLARPVVKIRECYVDVCLEGRFREVYVQFGRYCWDCSDVELFYNLSSNRYALKDTFQEKESLVEFFHSGHRFHSQHLHYFPTDQTIWFGSPIDCLKSIENARFPQDQEILASIPGQITGLIENDE